MKGTRAIRLRPDRVAPLTRGPSVPRWVAASASVAIYLALSAFLWRHVWLGSAARDLTSTHGDPVQGVWFLAWTANALTHGWNPLLSHAIFAPWGVNMVSNASVLLPGLLLAPVTLLWGPIASLNVVLLLAPVAASVTAYLLARKFTGAAAAFAAGLLFGFCPMVVGDLATAHVDLVVGYAWLPLIVLWLYKLLVEQRGKPWVAGLALAGCGVGEFFTSSELLVDAGLLAVIGTVLLAALGWRRVRAGLPHALRGGVVALVAGGAALAYPVWFALAGPQHLTRPVGGGFLALAGTSLRSLVAVPHATSSAFLANYGYPGVLPDNGAYLGVPLAMATVAAVVWRRRDRVVIWSFAMAVVSTVLALGHTLNVEGGFSGLTTLALPFSWISGWPVLDNVQPGRFMYFTYLFVGLVLACGLQALAGRGAIARRWRGARWGLAAAVAAVTMGPLVQAWPSAFATAVVDRPRWAQAAPLHRLRSSSVLFTYPLTSGFRDEAMLWQAMNGFPWSLVGGYAYIPESRAAELPASATAALLSTAAADPRAAPGRREVAAVRSELRAWRVSLVFLDRRAGAAGAAGAAAAAIEPVLGSPALRIDDVEVWRLRGSA